MTGTVDVPRRHGPMIAVVAVILFLHFLLRPALIGLPVAPDFLTGGLLLATLHMRAGYAALLGFLLGILEAALGLEGLGGISLVYVLTGYIGARSRDLLFADARYYVFGYLFVGTWLARIGLMLAIGVDLDPYSVLIQGGVVAALTALLCGAAELGIERLRQ
jgi:cell shape-determining protein MreD